MKVNEKRDQQDSHLNTHSESKGEKHINFMDVEKESPEEIIGNRNTDKESPEEWKQGMVEGKQ